MGPYFIFQPFLSIFQLLMALKKTAYLCHQNHQNSICKWKLKDISSTAHGLLMDYSWISL